MKKVNKDIPVFCSYISLCGLSILRVTLLDGRSGEFISRSKKDGFKRCIALAFKDITGDQKGFTFPKKAVGKSA